MIVLPFWNQCSLSCEHPKRDSSIRTERPTVSIPDWSAVCCESIFRSAKTLTGWCRTTPNTTSKMSRDCVCDQLRAKAAPIIRIAFSYTSTSDYSNSKPLSQMIYAYGIYDLAHLESPTDQQHIVDCLNCLRRSNLDWGYNKFGITRVSTTTTKLSIPITFS